MKTVKEETYRTNLIHNLMNKRMEVMMVVRYSRVNKSRKSNLPELVG